LNFSDFTTSIKIEVLDNNSKKIDEFWYPFMDVEPRFDGDKVWWDPYIISLWKKGVVKGPNHGAYYFRPNDAVTRAEFIKMAVEAVKFIELDEPSPDPDPERPDGLYQDVSDIREADRWFYPYVKAAWNAGWLDKEKALFNPHCPLTRAEAAKIVVMALGGPTQDYPLSVYEDVVLSDWHIDFIMELTQEGILNGFDEKKRCLFKPNQPLNRGEAAKIISKVASSKPITSIVVFIHGVNTSPESAYTTFLNGISQAKLPHTLFIQIRWPSVSAPEASDSVGGRAYVAYGMPHDAWTGVAKLKNAVGACRDVFGPNVPITILAHSQGTVITLAALQEGMKVDHWILMGSPLDRENSIQNGSYNTDLGAAARNVSGKVVNLWSWSDDTARLKGGIGGFGLPESIHTYTGDNIIDVEIKGVDHYGAAGWWAMEWLKPGYSGAWVSHRGTMDRDGILNLMHGETPRLNTKKRITALGVIQKNALNATELDGSSENGSWYGDANYNVFKKRFYLTQGMRSGVYFSDKDRCTSTVECLQGSLRYRIRQAVGSEFNKGTAWTTLGLGASLAESYMVDSLFSDAVLWLEIEGVAEDGVTIVDVNFEAWDD